MPGSLPLEHLSLPQCPSPCYLSTCHLLLSLKHLEQVPDLDLVIAPVGGGGLTAGILTVTRAAAPHIGVFAAEPAVETDALESWKSGTPTASKNTPTIADGLRAPLGALNTAVVHKHLDAVVHATEEAIASAAELLTSETRTIVEPSAAVGLAAMIENPDAFPVAGKRVALVLTGGNITP